MIEQPESVRTEARSRRTAALVLFAFVFLSATSGTLRAQEQEQRRDPVWEAQVIDELRAIDPEAVPLFEAATVALDNEDFSAAMAGFGAVLDLAPGFDHALRRKSHALGQLGYSNAAVVAAKEALALNPQSPYNKAVLAEAFLNNDARSDDNRALVLAEEAVRDLPDDAYANTVLGLAGLEMGDLEAIQRAGDQLVALGEQDPFGHLLLGVAAAENEDWDKARSRLDTATALGLSQSVADGILAQEPEPAADAPWEYPAAVVALWLMALVVVGLLGRRLNDRTLRLLDASAVAGEVGISPREQRMRTIYRWTVVAAGFLFYASLPFLLVIVMASGVLVFWAMINAGLIHIGVLVFLGISIPYTIWAVFKSILYRVPGGDRGRRLERHEAPALFALAERIASEAETDPIHAILLSPGVEVAVVEHSDRPLLRRGAERQLILGLGTLNGMTIAQLTSVLAHEYGHFVNGDTAGGTVAYRTRLSMAVMATELAHAGLAGPYNAAWLFLDMYHTLFLRISQGASRLQEALADRIAARINGPDTLAAALTHVVRQQFIFDDQVATEVDDISRNTRAISNIYQLPLPDYVDDPYWFEKRLAAALTGRDAELDSHPPLEHRLAYVATLPQTTMSANSADAWSLFTDPAQIRATMTYETAQRIAAHGIRVAFETQSTSTVLEPGTYRAVERT
ncbi:MAG: M48 family metalloprotease [Hyphomicrobiales bacterium]|nr:M48 family metalloprotease [Hyphomicrobiales bacterium]